MGRRLEDVGRKSSGKDGWQHYGGSEEEAVKARKELMYGRQG